MGKLVTLLLQSGNFEQGFQSTLRIEEDNTLLSATGEDATPNITQITGRLPPAPEMPQRLNDEWRRVFNPDDNSRIRPKSARITNFSRTDLVNNFVEYLNNWLNSGDRDWQKIRDGLQQHLSKDEEIRVIIQTQDPLLRRLPWQAWNLFVSDYPKAEIALSPTTFQTPGDLPPSQSKKVRILAVLGENTVADGSQEIDIQFDQRELEKLRNQGAEIKFLKRPSPQELREYLWQEKGWHIFFYAGHSFSNEDGNVGEIILNSEEKSLKITELQEALRNAITRGLQLAIFNSCDGLGLANQLAELNIRQMIVMREPVPDQVAKAFLQHFLTAFACHNQSVYAAVREARLRLEDWEEQFPGTKWLPVICQNPAVIPPTWKKLRTGGRIYSAGWNVNPLTRQEYQNRQILLNKVRNFWVQGVLEKSLHGRVLIELGLEERLNAVNHLGQMVWETPDQPRQILPTGTRIIDKFDEMGAGRTLLILGEPGSGKTTTLLELARDLIDGAETDPNQPIPVVFNLSSWGNKKPTQTIDYWLVQELNRGYQVSKKLGTSWVNEQKLLLLLDGLDEVKEERRNLCVQALNQFRQNYGETEIAIASRIRDYERLSHPLDLQSAIYLQPLTTEQINHYFDSVGSMAVVKKLWQEDETLQELAKSPLMLNIMTLAYQGMEIEDLPRINLLDERRRHLFDKYIQRMFERRRSSYKQLCKASHKPHSHKSPYTDKESKRWLTWLAKRMSLERETVFLIERMQPSLLRNGIQRWMYRIGLVFATGIIIHLILYLFDNFIMGLIYLPIHESFYGVSASRISNPLINRLFLSFFNPSNFFIGLLFGIIHLIISKFRNKEEIIAFESIALSKKQIKTSFSNGSKNGVILGIIICLIIILLNYFVNNNISIQGKYNSFYSFSLFAGSISFLMMYLSMKRIFYERHNDNFFIILLLIIVIFICALILSFTPFLVIPFFAVVGALYSGLISILFFGLKGKDLDVRISPNQGIWSSIRNAIFLALIGGLIFGSITALISWLSHQPFVSQNHENSVLYNLIITSGFCGITFFLIPGISVIKHITLRVILYWKKYIPWNYARFLDYATERIFLQKVGGGYIFIHRLLQEHFASLKLD